MSVDFKQLLDFQKKIEKLNNEQKEEFLEACCKELAARLLAKVIKRTPVGVYEEQGEEESSMIGGTLRRGWTTSSTGDSKRDTAQAMYDNMFGKNQNAALYAKNMKVKKIGNVYHIDIINPVEYASYVEYGHRQEPGRYVPAIGKSLKAGWVDGHHMLTISESELNSMSDNILQAKLNKFMKEVFKE